ERLQEEFGKDRLELLRRRIGGRHHHAAARSQLAEKWKGRRRGVDEDDAAGQGLEEIRPSRGAQIRSDQVEFRVLAVGRRAVSDQEDEQLILFRELLSQLGKHPLHLLARRLLYALALGLRQHDEPVVVVAELLAEQVGE